MILSGPLRQSASNESLSMAITRRADRLLIRQAVIMAGGKGTRLHPYSALFPKPLMPLGDMPILELLAATG